MELRESMDKAPSEEIAQAVEPRPLLDLRRALFGLYAFAVCLTLLLPISDLVAWFTGLMDLPASSSADKYVHFGLFAGLTFLYRWSARIPWSWTSAALVLLAAIFFGGAIEVVQGWTGYRSAEWTDLLFDGVGASAGLAVSAVLLRNAR